MSKTRFTIEADPQFDFRATILSHGWYMLAPFSWDHDKSLLTYIYKTQNGRVLRLHISEHERGVAVSLPDIARLHSETQREITAIVSRILSIDWDLRPFYKAMRQFPNYRWLEDEKRGRILVGATLWEDLAKTLMTTNINWTQTIHICQRLCQLGPPHPSLPDIHAFPSPQRIAAMNIDDLSQTLRAGYRGPYLRDLAERIASGELDLAAWETLDSDSLFTAVKSLKGFGDYAAATINRMRGHFDKLAIDSACLEMAASLHNNGRKPAKADIHRFYAPYGQWRGLVMWMDIIRSHDNA